MSTALSPTFSHSQLRKRSPVVEQRETFLPSPSIYSPDVEGEVIRFDGVASGEVEERDEEEEQWSSVRLVDDEGEKEESKVALERASSIATLDRPFVGRSISYLLAPLRTTPLLTANIPTFPSISIPSPLTTPGRSILMSRSTTSSSRSSASGSVTFATAPSRTSSTSRTITTMGARSFSGQAIEVKMDRTSSIDSTVRFVKKFPDRWYEKRWGRDWGERESSVEEDLWEEKAREEKESWKWEKWVLVASVASLFGYGIAGLICALVTWFRTWPQADVVVITDTSILIALTLSSLFCLLLSLIGLIGTLLNSRPILATYTFLLWPVGITILLVGYGAFKKEKLSLDLKLNQAWSQWFGDEERLRIQDSLHCCGYYSPYHEATFSKFCYPRTPLPGCKGKLFRFEKSILHRCWTAAFVIAPFHIFNIFVAMVCSNHVNTTFGKGLMPRQYRLNVEDVQENALAIIRSLPPPPSVRRSSMMSKSSSLSSGASVLSFMPLSEVDTGLKGLGMVDLEEEEFDRELETQGIRLVENDGEVAGYRNY